jgi:hypothetical protein
MPPIDWVQVLTFAGTTGIFTALLTNGLAALGGVLKERRNAAHLALQLAAHIEQFAHEAASAAADVEAYVSSLGHLGVPMRPIPELGKLPDDVEAWRALKGNLRNRALSLPLMVSHWRARMQFEADNAEPDSDYSRSSLEGNARLALGSLELAEALRRSYRWWDPSPPVVHGETVWLRKAIAAVERAKSREQEEHNRAVQNIVRASEQSR